MTEAENRASVLLAAGQAHEARGISTVLAEALRYYDAAIAELRSIPGGAARPLAIACMNRGNVLQKISAVEEAVAAYDEAIALLGALPYAEDAGLRNSLGAAWLNRGRALQLSRVPDSLAAAIRSQEEAIAVLRELPLDGPSFYSRNLAGAWLNLADALLGGAMPELGTRAADAACAAMNLVASREGSDPAFADLGLKARRALVEAIGHLLVAAGSDVIVCGDLAAAASDAIDDGLALARRWETRGDGLTLRPLAVRLFRFGAELYRLHQPQFLVEFLLENLVPPAFADDGEFRQIAEEALAAALTEVSRPRILRVGDEESEKIVGLVRELAAAQRQIARQTATTSALSSSP